jgi:ubiquinone/menaquinone biosynthesis C-methylase UbiE
MKCRHCASELTLPFIDLGSAPPSNAYLSVEGLQEPEVWYPLRLLVCEVCWLVQTEDHAGRESLFTKDYAYFSSFSKSWLDHAESYVQEMISRLNLDASSRIVEIAANDGYLLQYVKAAGIPCYGVEPTASTAASARAKGIEIIERFFGVAMADELSSTNKNADLIIANNVLAHVPDINDFVGGFTRLLKPTGVASFEFPHLLRMVSENQFDTAYHEHYSYLSLTAVERIFVRNGLTIFDVQELSTHGGSLRVFARRSVKEPQAISSNVFALRKIESEAGMAGAAFYKGFQAVAEMTKNNLLTFLLDKKLQGKKVVGYGAAAKGNTILNYAGVRPDLLSWVIDRNPAKQGLYLPGSRIPIFEENHLQKEKPDFIIILPWNLKEEVMQQLEYVKSWGGCFVTVIPKLQIVRA